MFSVTRVSVFEALQAFAVNKGSISNEALLPLAQTALFKLVMAANSLVDDQMLLWLREQYDPATATVAQIMAQNLFEHIHETSPPLPVIELQLEQLLLDMSTGGLPAGGVACPVSAGEFEAMGLSEPFHSPFTPVASPVEERPAKRARTATGFAPGTGAAEAGALAPELDAGSLHMSQF